MTKARVGMGLLLLMLAAPAWAAKVTVYGESAQLPTGSVGCTKTPHTNSVDNWTTIDCAQTGSNPVFTLHGYVPPGTGHTFGGVNTTVTYQTSDTNPSKTCAWDIHVLSVIDATVETLAVSAYPVYASNIAQTHSASKFYIATASSGSIQKDNGSGTMVDCTAAECNDKDARVTVKLNTALTSAGITCKFKTAVLDFP